METKKSIPTGENLTTLLLQGKLSIHNETEGLRLLSAKKVAEKAGMSIASLYRTLKDGDFPKPIAVGPSMKRWLSTEIDEWIHHQVRRERTKQLRNAASKGGKAKARKASELKTQ